MLKDYKLYIIVGILIGALLSDIITGYICNDEGYLISIQYGKFECNLIEEEL